MRASFEFLFSLLDCGETACVAQTDREGEHGPALRLWQRMGFIDSEPGVNPVAGCPHCGEGVPYALGSRLLCPLCRSEVDPSCLLLWRVHLSALLDWIAKQWHLRGGVRRLEDRLWQLGSLESAEGIFECFYRKAGDLSRPGKDRLLAYRQAIVLHGVPLARETDESSHPHLNLTELLQSGEPLSLADPSRWLRLRSATRFDLTSGALWSGDELLGEVPVGTREYHFLACLAAHLDRFVSYTELKRSVLRQSGSTDTTEEATFCQGMKSRIKRKWIPRIDRLLVSTNKADGYRLRAVTGA